MTLRGRGITYDTGFFPGGKNSRPDFDPAEVGRDMRTIAHDLHCTSVRITGGLPERLSVAAEAAAAEGLEVWFSPFPCEIGGDDLRAVFAECADRAEKLRLAGARITLVMGCEMTLFTAGFLPGDSVYERLGRLGAPGGPGPEQVYGALNRLLAEVVTDARGRFGGPVTYAAGVWEDIDWAPFDMVAVDAYRDEHNNDSYRDDVRALFQHGKPVVVTEFGCCTYRGAGAKGGLGWAIVDGEADPPRLDGAYVRDEGEQVRYLTEQLEVFDAEGVDTAFWFTFASYGLVHREDPTVDLDMASYGVVRMAEDGPSEPKQVFDAMAKAYQR